LLNALTRPLRFGLALGLCAGPMLLPTPAMAAQTLVVSAGAESPGGDVQLNAFAPNMINVNVGDTVTWHLDSTEFHNIFFPSGTTPPEFVLAGPDGVFLNPQAGFPTGGPNYDGSAPAGSGLLNKGDSYSLTFTKAGNYQFLCDIHAGMGGIVNVTAAGGTADSQAAIDARRASQVNSELANKGIPAIMSNLGELATEGSSAGIAAGVQNGLVDALRFFPPRITIKAGDNVTWIWKTDETPHTVTFLGGQPAPDVVVPQPQPNGPPKLQLNPQVLAPAGDNLKWAGGTYLNSGFLQPMPGQPTPTYSVTFIQPGTYDYVCLLHEGMVGTIVVESS
jgi:plastocyanin